MPKAGPTKPRPTRGKPPATGTCNVTDTLSTCQHGPLSSSACGLSIVVPTMGRRPKLVALLFKLLLHPLMQRETSEILLSHGSDEAWQMRGNLSSRLEASSAAWTRVAGWDDRPGQRYNELPRAVADTSKLRHIDGSVTSAELGAADRYLAAGHARNEVIVHVDDDAVPDEHNLELISRTFCSVHAEAGFPTYAGGLSPSVHGPTARYCGPLGYGSPMKVGWVGREVIVLTNLAATPRALVSRFLQVFDSRYRTLMRHTRGDGEDIVFADAARRAGARLHGIQGTDYRYGVHTEQGVQGAQAKSYSKRKGHFELRAEICCCLGQHNVTTRGTPPAATAQSIRYPQLLSDDDGSHQQIWTAATHPTRRSMGTRLAACVSGGACIKEYLASLEHRGKKTAPRAASRAGHGDGGLGKVVP